MSMERMIRTLSQFQAFAPCGVARFKASNLHRPCRNKATFPRLIRAALFALVRVLHISQNGCGRF